MKESYKKQVLLLLDILPEIAKEEVLALHGGTAINLFGLNMPRLSIDVSILVTYLISEISSTRLATHRK
ncbi:MAG: hypothetical protein BGO29_08845 [Bacteroidales bacterium 36-12]|nr:MAG: hypothetical protein BGO29_08845 [Bacteroidales bacterium 36-12]